MNEAQIKQLRIMLQEIRYKINDLELKTQSYEVEEQKGLICPNCEKELQLQHKNKNMKEFGICDIYECEDCSHIKVLDWVSDENIKRVKKNAIRI